MYIMYMRIFDQKYTRDFVYFLSGLKSGKTSRTLKEEYKTIRYDIHFYYMAAKPG